MNTKSFFFSAAAIVFAACNRMENPVERNIPVALSYNTVTATETRAAQNLNDETFASGEIIKVRIRNTGTGEWKDYTYTTGSAGAMTPPTPGPYYPAGAQNIDIVAYYPASAGASFTVAADQTDDACYMASDLMFASVNNQAKQAQTVTLDFSHKMAKFCVNVTPGDGVNSISSVSILNVKPTVSLNQTTGEVAVDEGASTTTIAISNEGAAVIPAQTIDGGLLSIVTDQGTATYSVAGKEFKAGNMYTINITVNIRAVGTTTLLTGWTGQGTVTVTQIEKDKSPEGVEAIDMGSGLKWSNMNLGATTVTGYGDYFAWGATVPFYVDHDAYGNEMAGHWINGKYSYDWYNYPFEPSYPRDQYHITKYNDSDGKTSFADFNYVDDAARAIWGGYWRTPTHAEWDWLLGNCTWVWQTDYNGVTGMLVTSRVNGNTIFLPAAGFRNTNLYQAGSLGRYWASDRRSDIDYNAWCLRFDQSEKWTFYNERYNGYSVRPVTE